MGAAKVTDAPEGGELQLLVVPIFAALPPERQARVFKPAPAGTRKVCQHAVCTLVLALLGPRHLLVGSVVELQIMCHAVQQCNCGVLSSLVCTVELWRFGCCTPLAYACGAMS